MQISRWGRPRLPRRHLSVAEQKEDQGVNCLTLALPARYNYTPVWRLIQHDAGSHYLISNCLHILMAISMLCHVRTRQVIYSFKVRLRQDVAEEHFGLAVHLRRCTAKYKVAGAGVVWLSKRAERLRRYQSWRARLWGITPGRPRKRTS